MKKQKIIKVVLFIFMFIGCYLSCYADAQPPSSDTRISNIFSAIFLFGSVAMFIVNIYLSNKFLKAKDEIMTEVKQQLMEKQTQIDKHIESTDNNVQKLEDKFNDTKIEVVERINTVSEKIIDRINNLAIVVAKGTKD